MARSFDEQSLPQSARDESTDAADRRALRASIEGYRSTTLVYVAASLGLADRLAHGPATVEELATALEAHAPSLRRLVRGLDLLGVVHEDSAGRVALTELGALLRSDVERSMRDTAMLAVEQHLDAWRSLAHTIRTGETAFEHIHGTTVWEHRKSVPALGAAFDRYMATKTELTTAAVLAAIDLDGVASIVDIGGGVGALLGAILEKHRHVRGTLFDQPHVLDAARAHLTQARVIDRCEIVGGSFFESVPEGADRYLLKSILHDFPDQPCIRLLQTLRKAMKPTSRLLVVEHILPEDPAESPEAVWTDLHMMAVTGGRERTAAEYRSLLDRAGLSLEATVATDSPFAVITASPRPG